MITIFALLILPPIASVFAILSSSARANQRVTLLAGIAHLLASLHCLVSQENPFPSGWWLAVDPLGGFFLTILLHTFVLVVLYSPTFLQRTQGAEYDAAYRLFYLTGNYDLLANTLVLAVQHFGMLWP